MYKLKKVYNSGSTPIKRTAVYVDLQIGVTIHLSVKMFIIPDAMELAALMSFKDITCNYVQEKI